MLVRDGIAVIWVLHLPPRAYQDGHKAMAAGIIEIAEAAKKSGYGEGTCPLISETGNRRRCAGPSLCGSKLTSSKTP